MTLDLAKRSNFHRAKPFGHGNQGGPRTLSGFVQGRRLEWSRRGPPEAAADQGEETSAEGVLENPPVLHDQAQIPIRIFEERQVAGRVAIHNQQVGEGAGSDHPERPLGGSA